MTIAGVHQPEAAWKPALARPANLLERKLRLSFEADLRRNARFGTTSLILSPGFRQIQPICNRQAGMMICNRQRHRHLTIRLFAKLPAVLMRNPNRMLPLLGKARIINNPGFGPLTDKMQQRLML